MFSSNQNQDIRDKIASFRPGMAFIVMIIGALVAFEIFNYSTTEHALQDVLGDLTFAGIPWATILSLAFCGIDFAGIARLFTPEQGADEPKEVWYLFGAWLLAATMNAILTWWGVSMAVVTHSMQSTAVVDAETLTSIVPVFVAVMVWVIRILIIGTLSMAMDRLLHTSDGQHSTLQRIMGSSAGQPARQNNPPSRNVPQPLNNSGYSPRPAVSRAASSRPSSAGSRSANFSGTDDSAGDSSTRGRAEPTYHSLNGDRSGNDRFRRS